MATIERAIRIAAKAHGGVKDKQGKPYLLHPVRVMMGVEGEAAQIVAILHDVVEDTAVSLDDVRDEGFGEEIIEALDLVTHEDDQPYSEYVIACKENEVARQVKLSDLRDNGNLNRLLLRPENSAAAVVGGYARDVRVPTWFGVRSENLARAERAGTETWRFALLGDVQQGLGAFRTALDRIRSEDDLALAVVCGDLVNQKSLPHYRVLFAAIERETPGVPVLTVPGNHDDPLIYQEHLGPRFWSARVGPDLIVGVDTSEVESPGPMLGDLAKVLATPGVRYRMVFMHRPTARPGRIRTRFAPLAKVLADGRVDAVFAGHLHHFESFRHEGVRYVTNGRGGDLTGGTVSKASLALVKVGPEGITANEVKLGERSEISWLLVSGLATRVYAPLGRLGVFLVAVLLAAASVLIAPPGGRRLTAIAALLSALPATGLPMLVLLPLGLAVLLWNRRVRLRSTAS